MSHDNGSLNMEASLCSADVSGSKGDCQLVAGTNSDGAASSQSLKSPETYRLRHFEDASDSSDRSYIAPDSWDGEGNDLQALYRSLPQSSNDNNGPRSRQEAKIRSYRDESRIASSLKDGTKVIQSAGTADPDPEGGNTGMFPRISKSIELLRHSYDYVVVGSGYGGSVAASRMARTGQSVCVLERGSERWAGERSSALSQQLHWSGDPPGPDAAPNGGDPTSLYHVLSGADRAVLVGNGLGGTSLINANSFLRPTEDILSLKAWPAELRQPEQWNRYYERVERVLQPSRYPDDWPGLSKLELLKKLAEALDMTEKFSHVPQTVQFRSGANSCGVEMAASSLRAEDSLGANDGSKTTTLVTYLADAWNWGAEIFCECEVRYIKKAKQGDHDGYLVLFAWHGGKRDSATADTYCDLMWVFARKAVFLGAGTFGTAEILLRSKENGLHVSDWVGQNISDNGDYVAFGYNVDHDVRTSEPGPQNLGHPYGPTTTSIIDIRHGHENPLDGYVIQDAAIPPAFRGLFETMIGLLPFGADTSAAGSLLSKAARGLSMNFEKLRRYFFQRAIDTTQVYVVLSHNASQTTMTLKKDRPSLDIRPTGRSDRVKYLDRVMTCAAQATGLILVSNFLPWGRKLTVHPIGGAQMARDGTGETGATNHLGEVFTGRGSETHEGLLVVDGALIPTSLGVGPLATISALAERIVELYAARHNLNVSMEPNGILDVFDAQGCLRLKQEEDESVKYAVDLITGARLGGTSRVEFTEAISGFMHIHIVSEPDANGDQRSFELAFQKAKGLFETARLCLTARSFRKAGKSSTYATILTGSLSYPALSGSPFMIYRGKLSAANIDPASSNQTSLVYDFHLRAVDGTIFRFHGYQMVDLSDLTKSRSLWCPSAPLYATITKPNRFLLLLGHSPLGSGSQVAKGILYFGSDRTARIEKPATPATTDSIFLQRAINVASVATHVAYQSFSLFFTASPPALQYPIRSYHGYINDTPPGAVYSISAADDIKSQLYMWEPTTSDIETRNLFMVTGAAAGHEMYALPTIPLNAVNYFRRAGYRVFVSVHRIGWRPHLQGSWTSYDARLDLKACLEHIRAAFGIQRIYTVAHCLGSVALACGLLDGTIPCDWILGITCSQVFMNPIWSPGGMMTTLATGFIPTLQLYNLAAGSEFRFASEPGDQLAQRVLNQLLKLYPDYRHELCNNAACHRITLALGRCWNHRNLNSPTHRQIDRFLTGVNTTLLQHAIRMGSIGHVVSNGPSSEPLTSPESITNLRGIPILMLFGADNAVVQHESIEKTYETLVDTFGGDGLWYRRRLILGYGHLDCWIGRNAWRDVYPVVREEVDRIVRGERYRFREPDDRFKHVVGSEESA